MPQHHLDRLTSTDASFLHQEGPASHMHIGGVALFEGPPPAFSDYLDHVRGRLHLVPRYRQKLSTPPWQTGRPVWIDDPNFNLEYHVRHSALPAPGTEQQLFVLAARIASQRLDRSKPLWESWLIEGLDGDRFALIFKTHHSLVDGISGVDLATVLLDLERAARPVEEGLEPWRPHPEPSAAELLMAGARGFVGTALRIAERGLQAAVNPAETAGKLAEAAEGVGEIVWAGLNPAPDTPLNVPIGPHRRFTVVRQELEDYKEVKNALGGTVNDVVLTVVAGALARWLRARGVRTQGLQMRALVPVSIRSSSERGTLGNRLAAMRGPLPVYISDPVARLRYVSRAMDGLKESKQALGAEAIARVNNLAPPTILAQASRLQFSTRLFNLLVTNIPGPQFPLYLLGRQLQDLFPVAFLPQNHALAVAIMSYNGGIDFGLLADYDAMPDLDLVATGLVESLAELVAAARGKPVKRGRRSAGSASRSEAVPASIVPAQGSRPKRGPAADMRAKRSGKRGSTSGRKSAAPGNGGPPGDGDQAQ
jgi:diacylglycerol O-acyltransferase